MVRQLLNSINCWTKFRKGCYDIIGSISDKNIFRKVFFATWIFVHWTNLPQNPHRFVIFWRCVVYIYDGQNKFFTFSRHLFIFTRKKNKFLVLPDPHPTPSLFFLGLIFSNVIAWVCFLLFGGVAYFGLSLSLWNCNEKLLLLRLGKIQLATLAFSEKDSKGRSGGRVCMLGSGSQPFWAKYNSSEQKNCLLKRFGPDFCQRLGLVTHCCWVYIFDTVFG